MKHVFLFLMCGAMACADELSETIATLDAAFQKLKGYELVYELKTEDGKTGTVELGLDRNSGASYLLSTLKNEQGEIFQKAQQWSTAEGTLIMQAGGELVGFEGANEVVGRINELLRVFNIDAKGLDARFGPQFQLTKKGVEMAIGFSGRSDQLFHKATKVIGKTDTEVTLDVGPNYGTIVVDLRTGLMSSQVIKIEEKQRSMTLTETKLDPDEKTITVRLDVPLDGIKKRSITEMGMGKTYLAQILQQFLKEAGKSEESVSEIEKAIPSFEPGLIGFLEGESLDQSGFLNKEVVTRLIGDALNGALKKIKAGGQEVTADQLLQIPGFRNQMLETFTQMLLPRTPDEKKQQYLGEALTRRLSAEGPLEVQARAAFEKLVLRAYFKIRLGQAVDRYRDDLAK